MVQFKHDLKIALSGAAIVDSPAHGKLSFDVGSEIANRGAILLTGATTGIPDYAARGAKSKNGLVIGFSPATTRKEHVKKYHLPTENHDIIFYSSFGYAHRNTLLTTMSDAVIVVSGRIGTLNEFTTTFEENKIIGVLLGSGGIADDIPHIIQISRRGMGHIVYDNEPKVLVEKVMKAVKLRHR
jgi:uncharacterized protein (TIGR00725 family)